MIPSPQCCILPAQLQWWSVLHVSLLHAVMGWAHPGPLLWVHSCPLQGGGIPAPADSLSLLVGGWMGNQILQPAEIEYFFFSQGTLQCFSVNRSVFLCSESLRFKHEHWKLHWEVCYRYDALLWGDSWYELQSLQLCPASLSEQNQLWEAYIWVGSSALSPQRHHYWWLGLARGQLEVLWGLKTSPRLEGKKKAANLSNSFCGVVCRATHNLVIKLNKRKGQSVKFLLYSVGWWVFWQEK